MFSKTLSAAAVILAATSLVSAQTHTDCNPLKKTCPNDPAFGNSKVSCDMSKGLCTAFKELDGTDLEFNGNGAVFKIESETNAPTIQTGKYIFFGRVDVEVQAAPGAGIVTSAVLQSDDLDEIDWEWVGGDNAQAQTNYFSKGDTTTYDRGAYHPVSNPTGSFHTYSVEWTSAAINWLIDGTTVRTLTAAEAKGGSGFPQTPMQVKLGTWVAGRKDAPEGTVQWSGGKVDWSQAPFNGYYKSISIVDYAGKDAPATGAVKEYIYGDNSGSWESIKVATGNGSTNSESDSSTTASSDDASTTVSTTVSQTATKRATKTSDSTATTTGDSTTASTGMTTMSTATSGNTDAATTGASATTSGGEAASTTAGAGAAQTGAALGGLALAGVMMVAQLL